MKYFLFITLLLSTLYAQETFDENRTKKLTIGLGIYGQSQPYKSVKNIIVPSPVIFFDNALFYVRWSRAGVYFLGEKKKDFSWAFSLTAQPRTFGYKTKDIKDLTGLNERKTTIEGGLAFSALYHKHYIEVMLLTDLLARDNTWLIKTEIGDEFHFGKFSLYPSLIMSYQSDAFVNYYYGVTQEEANNSHFTFFKPKGGFQVGGETFLTYPLSKNLSTMLNARVDSIVNTAQESPLLKDSFVYSGLISLIYTFHY